EFFAVTASIFLAGKESIHEPKTRAALKEKMPDYYKYLVGVFGFDPDPSLPNPPEKDKDDKDKASVPVASASYRRNSHASQRKVARKWEANTGFLCSA